MVKAGEKFEYVGKKTDYYTPGKIYAVTQETYRDGSHCMQDDGGDQHWWDEESMKGSFKPYSPTQGPIREVRRREISDGVYGIVKVCNSATLMEIYINARPSPEELREAAHTLSQIAEVAEENESNFESGLSKVNS